MAGYRTLRWLCWTLIGFVVVSAVLTLTLNQNPFAQDVPDSTDFVERLVLYRGFDRDVYVLALVSSLVALGVYLIAALLGTALRQLAPAGAARDLMAGVFVIGGVIGIAAQLVNIGVNTAATQTYCDCGYKTYEVIGQAYALGVGWTVQQWLAVGAITIIGVGAGMAGRVVDVSRDWRLLSYLIAVGLIIGAVLQVLDLGPQASLVVGVVSGIAVPIWAFLLARSLRSNPAPESTPA